MGVAADLMDEWDRIAREARAQTAIDDCYVAVVGAFGSGSGPEVRHDIFSCCALAARMCCLALTLLGRRTWLWPCA